MSVTKVELSDNLSNTLNLDKKDAKILVDNFFAAISSALELNEEVKISGFGNFKTRDKKARPGRDFGNGKEVVIAERRVVTFKQGTKLQEIVSNNQTIPAE